MFYDTSSDIGDEADGGDDADLDDVVDCFPLGDDDDDYDPGRDGLERGIDITVDSSAGAPVANRKHFPGVVVADSESSLRGQKFMGPGGDLIPNRGQMTPELVVESGDVGRINFADAEVRKPLLAVSAINRKGSPVFFDGSNSYILPKGAKELAEIRSLVRKVQQKIKLHENKGTFVMRT